MKLTTRFSYLKHLHHTMCQCENFSEITLPFRQRSVVVSILSNLYSIYNRIHINCKFYYRKVTNSSHSKSCHPKTTAQLFLCGFLGVFFYCGQLIVHYNSTPGMYAHRYLCKNCRYGHRSAEKFNFQYTIFTQSCPNKMKCFFGHWKSRKNFWP